MHTIHNNTWHKRNELQGSRDVFVFHSANVFVQFSKGSFPDEFGVAMVCLLGNMIKCFSPKICNSVKQIYNVLGNTNS